MWSAVVSLVIGCVVIIDGELYPEELESTTNTTGNGGLSTGAKIGIGVGGAVASVLAVIIIVLVIAKCCYDKCKKRGYERLPESSSSLQVGGIGTNCCICVGDICRKCCISVDLPQIIQQPANQLNVVPGTRVEFTVTATTDVEDLKYQWKLEQDGANVDPLPAGVYNATTNTLTITPVCETHEGTYTCVVSHATGATTSNTARLTLLDPPRITHQPANQLNIVLGKKAKFTVTATTDAGDLKYQWKLEQDGANVDPLPEGVRNDTTNTLTIPRVCKRHKGTYTCVVSNPTGATISNTALLTLRHACKCDKTKCIAALCECNKDGIPCGSQCQCKGEPDNCLNPNKNNVET